MTTDPASPAPRFESDLDYLKELRSRVHQGLVTLEYDHSVLGQAESPLAVQAEDTRWVFGGVFGAIGGWFLGGWPLALGLMALCLVGYLTLGRRWIAAGLERRAKAALLDDADTWRRLWRHGGVTLVAGPPAGQTRCTAPKESWLKFVDGLPPPDKGSGR